jgi:hypothetical protein
LQENFVELWGYGSPNRDATGHFVFTIGTTKDGSYKIASALSYSQKAKHSLREDFSPSSLAQP